MERCFTPFEEKGRDWRDYLGAEGKLILELACGAGSYTVALAERNPENRYIGVDIKGARIWFGATEAEEKGLPNVMFFRMQIEELAEHFKPGEIDEIWITFPDPHLPHRRRHKRLTSERFLTMYKELLGEDGVLHLKTDSKPLFDYTLEQLDLWSWVQLEKYENLYKLPPEEVPGYLTEIKTPYEVSHLAEGRKIYYVKSRPF